MPVFQNASGDEPEIVLAIGRFRRRLIRHRDDPGLAVLVAVELDALARFHIGVEPLAIAPERLLAIDDRPAQAACLVIEIIGAEVVAVATSERGIFLEYALLDIEAELLG